MVHWFSHGAGLDNPAGRMYLFWSGIGANLAYLSAIAVLWRHLNCHAQGCWRLARHPVEGTPYKVCHHHHPDLNGRNTHPDHIAAAARAAQ